MCVCVCVCVHACVCVCVLLNEMASLLSQSERSKLADDEDTEYQLLKECQAAETAYYNNSGQLPQVSKLKVSSVCVCACVLCARV